MPTSANTAMAVQPRGGLARVVGLVGAVCAVSLWAVAGGPGLRGSARVAPQVLYVPNAPLVAAPEGVWAPPALVDTPARAGAPSMMDDAARGRATSLEQLALNDD